MIVAQELHPDIDAVQIHSFEADQARLDDFNRYLGIIAHALPTPELSAKEAQIVALAQLGEKPVVPNKALFSVASHETARAQLEHKLLTDEGDPDQNEQDIMILDSFEAGMDYERVTAEGLVADDSFKAEPVPLEETFIPSDRGYGVAQKLWLSHTAMQFELTENGSEKQRAGNYDHVHDSLVRVDEAGVVEPVLTLLNDAYLTAMNGADKSAAQMQLL